MGVVDGAARSVSRTVNRAASATTAAAGAVGGAAVNGVAGAVTGAAAGVQKGIDRGSHSTPAAALTLGALGVAGLVEWPILLAVGGGALLLRRLSNSRTDGPVASVAAVKVTPAKSTSSATPAKSTSSATPAKSTGSATPAKSTSSARPRKTPAKRTAARKSGGAQSRSRR
jgi:cell division septation protein DedD